MPVLQDQPADSPKTNVIVAHAGREAPLLPVSSGLPQLPESPRTPHNSELKPNPSIESVSSTHSEGHLLAGRGSKSGYSSAAETFEEVSLQGTQVQDFLAFLLSTVHPPTMRRVLMTSTCADTRR